MIQRPDAPSARITSSPSSARQRFAFARLPRTALGVAAFVAFSVLAAVAFVVTRAFTRSTVSVPEASALPAPPAAAAPSVAPSPGGAEDLAREIDDTLERQAVDAVARGDLGSAAKLYGRIASRSRDWTFRDAARISRAKARAAHEE